MCPGGSSLQSNNAPSLLLVVVTGTLGDISVQRVQGSSAAHPFLFAFLVALLLVLFVS